MELGENAPLQKGSSEPHGPKADRINHSDFVSTEACAQAMYDEADEF